MTTTDSDSEVYDAHWAKFPLLFARRYTLRTYANFKASRMRTKVIVLGLLAFYAALATAFIVIGPKRVSQAVYAAAQGLRATPGGEFILGAVMVVSSVPPMIGFTTTTTLCGFVYGLRGYAIAGPATYIGSALSFILLRLLFRQRIRQWANDSPNWRALGSVIRAKGLPLICLIRLCPLPWTGSNMLFASIETVSFGQFMLATTPLQLKIFLAVFVGARLAKLSNGEERDPTSTIINTISIIVAVTIGVLTGVYVWRITRAEIDKLESIPVEERRLAEDTIEDLEEAPFVEPYRD